MHPHGPKHCSLLLQFACLCKRPFNETGNSGFKGIDQTVKRGAVFDVAHAVTYYHDNAHSADTAPPVFARRNLFHFLAHVSLHHFDRWRPDRFVLVPWLLILARVQRGRNYAARLRQMVLRQESADADIFRVRLLHPATAVKQGGFAALVCTVETDAATNAARIMYRVHINLAL